MPTVLFGDNTGDDYAGLVEDCYLYKDNPTGNNNGASHIVGRDNTANAVYRPLTRFRINSTLVGLGATSVDAATMNLYCSGRYNATNRAAAAYRLLQNWVENQASWDNYATSSAWNTGGADSASDSTGEDSTADRRATAETSVDVGDSGAYYQWDLTTAAEAWRAGSWSEYGVILIGVEGSNFTYKIFQSSEGTDGQRPYLSVTYTAGGGTTVNITDMLSGGDQISVNVTALIKDTLLAGFEALQITAINPVDLTDEGATAEAMSRAVEVTLAETALGSELLSLGVDIQVVEDGAAGSAILVTVPKEIVDSVIGMETVSAALAALLGSLSENLSIRFMSKERETASMSTERGVGSKSKKREVKQ